MADKRKVDVGIRTARTDETATIIELLNQSMGERSLSRDDNFWLWKHRDSPFGASPCLVAEAEGRVVGVRAFSRWLWECDGHEIKAVRAVDTATHPDFQGCGIFSKLTTALLEQMKQEGVGFAFNTPNTKVMPGYLKLGWKQVGRVPLWIRPLRPFNMVKAMMSRGETSDVSIDLGDFAPVADLFTQPSFDGFALNRKHSEGHLQTVRSADYLRWRYGAIPKYRYFAHWALDGADKAAVILRGKRRRGMRELLVCEILTTGEKGAKLAGQLLRDVARKSNADYAIACALEGSADRQSLISALFVPVPKLGPMFTARPIDEKAKMPDPTQWTNWRCSIGDLEVF